MPNSKDSKKNFLELCKTQNRNQDKTKVWGKRSLIFTHTNTQLFQGLLDLTKQKSNTLSESFDQNQKDSLCNDLELDIKDETKNPFKEAKLKAMMRNSKQSIKTAQTIPKEQKDAGILKQLLEFNEKFTFEDLEMITMKQVNQRYRGKKREAVKSYTDRTFVK